MSGNRKIRNFKLFEDFAYYIPGVKGMFMMLVMLLLGFLLGGFFSRYAAPLLGLPIASMVSYVLMFLPPMFYALLRSHSNSVWGEGVAVSSSNVSPLGWPLAALLVSVATYALAFMTDALSSLMPEMPEWLRMALQTATQGNLFLNLLTVSIFAPLFEEWLCRGEILRGLLNHQRSDGSRMKPFWAIVISALFFAVIHGNPWQALPAFILGCLFGYVYYKTGSLWLTMLMHCVNNTVSVLVAHSVDLSDKDTWVEAIGLTYYSIFFVVCALLLAFCIYMFRRIPLQKPEGNCDRIAEAK